MTLTQCNYSDNDTTCLDTQRFFKAFDDDSTKPPDFTQKVRYDVRV